MALSAEHASRPAGFSSGSSGKADVARLLLLGPIDQPHGRALDDQSERDAGLVEQSLELLLGRFDPGGLVGLRRLAIEIDVGREPPARADTSGEPVLGGLGPSVGEAGLERVVVLDQVVPQLVGRFGPLSRRGVPPGRRTSWLGPGAEEIEQVRLPAEELGQERPRAAKRARRVLVVVVLVVRRTGIGTVRASRARWASADWSGNSIWAARRALGEKTRPSETGLR